MTKQTKNIVVATAFSQGYYNVEIDVWKVNETFFLGHDSPQYEIPKTFFEKHMDKFWIHCKNLSALAALHDAPRLNVFFHSSDDATLTSSRYIWTGATKPLMPNSVCVLPELGIDGDIKKCYGVCTDYVERWEKKLK